MNTFQKYNFNSKEKKMHFKNRKHPPSHSEVLKSTEGLFVYSRTKRCWYFKQTNNDAYYKTLCLHHPEVDNQDSGHTLGHGVCISQRNTESHRPHSWCPLKRQTDHLDCPQKCLLENMVLRRYVDVVLKRGTYASLLVTRKTWND